MKDKRGYDIPDTMETGAATDYPQLKELSESLLVALGSTQYEFGTPTLTYLKAWDMEVDPAEGEDADFDNTPINERRICTKAFYKRSVDGISIGADKMVFSYALDGTFRKMIGMWKPIDWEASNLSVEITSDQYINKLQAFVIKDDDLLQAAILYGVDTKTCFATVPQKDGNYILELKGCARFYKQNLTMGKKEGMWETHYFDLVETY